MQRMVSNGLAAAWLSLCLMAAQPAEFAEHVLAKGGEGAITGYDLEGRTLFTWGDRLSRRSLPDGKAQVIRGPGVTFGEGGCLLDVDGDGQPDVVVNEGGSAAELVWYGAPHSPGGWTRHVIDSGVDAPDMLATTLLGHRGVLLIHKRMQVRFYEIPADPTARWPSQDVYSFYSPSHQGGLRMADIDGDGRPDILAGMYWIHSPESFELPWRLFAIMLWNETLESAMLRVSYGSLDGGPAELIAAQREMQPARLAWLEKPADPRQLWTPHGIDGAGDLAQVNSLATADFDGDGRLDILVAEKAGKGRLMVLYNEGQGRFRPVVVAHGHPIRFARALDVNGDGRPDVLAIGGHGIAWFENRTHTGHPAASAKP